MARKISQSNGSKKDMIAKMLLDNDNKYSVREIARVVGTTEGNVFKEKSRLKATGILTDQRLSVFSHSNGEETLTLASAETKTLVTHYGDRPLTDLPPLNQEDLKKMYGEFQNGRTPVEVIAENGFNPKLVEYEYGRFCRMNRFDIGTLVRGLVEEYDLGTRLSESLLQRSKGDGIISNDDIRTIFESVSNSISSKVEQSVIERMKNGNSVGTFRPAVCSLCGLPMRGAMIDFQSEIGRKILESLGTGTLHDSCNNEVRFRARY